MIAALRLPSAAALLWLLGCEGSVAAPRPQWLISIGSDAPVPAIFDRLQVEVSDENGAICDGCTRLFGLDAEDDLPLSFGAALGDGELTLRARLSRADRVVADGSPDPRWSIDAIGVLPPPDAVLAVGLSLDMRCLGIPADPVARESCDPAIVALEPIAELGADDALPVTGSWPPATDQPCPADPPGDMVCMPGGLFVMGGDEVIVALPTFEGIPEQLVQLAPFAIDRDEVTLGAFLAVVDELPGRPLVHADDINVLEWACTYLGDDEHGNDALAVNCIPPWLAALACEQMGKRLPTEAEWEFVAGNRSGETTYPWGHEDEDLCARAWLARGRTLLESSVGSIESSSCRGIDPRYGVVAGGIEGDITTLGVRNLAGNVSEWVADGFIPFGDDVCWPSTPMLHVDPLCAPTGAPLQAIRGGSYASDPITARGVGRSAGSIDEAFFNVGFRCALSL